MIITTYICLNNENNKKWKNLIKTREEQIIKSNNFIEIKELLDEIIVIKKYLIK